MPTFLSAAGPIWSTLHRPFWVHDHITAKFDDTVVVIIFTSFIIATNHIFRAKMISLGYIIHICSNVFEHDSKVHQYSSNKT